MIYSLEVRDILANSEGKKEAIRPNFLAYIDSIWI